VRRQGQGRCLARCLGGPVDPERIELMIRPVGPALLAVEHEIRAHLQQPAARFGQGLGKGAGGTGIHDLGQLGLAFGLVHCCVGAGVEHPIRALRLYGGPTGLTVGQIQLGAAAGHQLHPRRR
jgi:hypothetical protein